MSQAPDEDKPTRRRESFDMVADDYDLCRPPYLPAVVDAVISSSGLHAGGSVLEIGCGAGQLSVPLARFGVNLVAVELGPHLAALASRNLEPFPNAQVEVSSFEAWPLPREKFDAVLSANSFHWLDPAIRFAKAAEALRPGGSLTILHVHHVRGGTPGFIADTQPIYIKWGLSDDPFFQPTTAENAPLMYPELGHAPEFCAVERHRHKIPRNYSTAAYIGLLRTDSLINSLDDAARRGFLEDIERLIELNYSGEVARNYVYEVVTAQRAP